MFDISHPGELVPSDFPIHLLGGCKDINHLSCRHGVSGRQILCTQRPGSDILVAEDRVGKVCIVMLNMKPV